MKDEVITIDPSAFDEYLDDDTLDQTLIQPFINLTNIPIRCLILTKGAEGVTEDINKFVGPKISDNDEEFERFEVSESN